MMREITEGEPMGEDDDESPNSLDEDGTSMGVDDGPSTTVDDG